MTDSSTEDTTPVYDLVTDDANPRRHSWSEFRSCGLLWVVNTVLHIFGWAIVVDDSGEVYPARTSWRGFPEATQERAHRDLAHYIALAHRALREEAGGPDW